MTPLPLQGLYYYNYKTRQPRKKFNWVWLLLALFLFLLLIKHAKAETASWYSYESCRKEGTNGIYTASGKRFNENDYTAAMWGVPFGTLVKVTNIANGLSVTVRINDRGPAKRLVKKGRIIDLSKGAFRQIADLKQGIISVKIEIIKLVKGETIYATQE